MAKVITSTVNTKLGRDTVVESLFGFAFNPYEKRYEYLPRALAITSTGASVLRETVCPGRD